MTALTHNEMNSLAKDIADAWSAYSRPQHKRTRREIWAGVKDLVRHGNAWQIKPYTVSFAYLPGADPRGGALQGVGFAKCNPTDTWNAQRGIDIARGRAIADLLDKLMAEEVNGD